MKKVMTMTVLILAVLFGAILMGCTQNNGNTNDTNNASDTNQLVGGDADEHGCIGSAGYTWCEEKQKCLRTWEESCIEDTNAPANDENLPVVNVDENTLINVDENTPIVDVDENTLINVDENTPIDTNASDVNEP